tara:strand:+ start:2483 stop:2917 length:435 start_codon:yes stop_codon:yes gene_type:complete
MTINNLESESKKLALIHSLCFEKHPPPYSENTIQGFLKDKNYHLVKEEEKGFALARVIENVSELITLAVVPEFRRTGIANKLLCELIEKIKILGANQFTLEVAENNTPAINLYRKFNFQSLHRRKNYFSNKQDRLDAIVFIKLL